MSVSLFSFTYESLHLHLWIESTMVSDEVIITIPVFANF